LSRHSTNMIQNSQLNETLASLAYAQAQSLATIGPSLTQIANKTAQGIGQQNLNGQRISPQLNLSQCALYPGLSLQTALSHQILNQQQILLPQAHNIPIVDVSLSSDANLKPKENTSMGGRQEKQLESLNDRSHSKEDEDAGRMLLGFISELRKNHLDVISTVSAADKSKHDTKLVSKTCNLIEPLKEVTPRKKSPNVQTAKERRPRKTKRALSRNLSPTSLSSMEALDNKVDKYKPLKLIPTKEETGYPEERLKNETSWPQNQSKFSNLLMPRHSSIISAPDYETASSFSANTRLQGFITTETSSGSTSIPCDLSGGETESSSSHEAHSVRDKINVDYSECVKVDSELGSVSSEDDNDRDSGPIRKRRKRHILAFTSRNISDHNNRMAAIQRNAMHGASSGIVTLHSILETNKERNFSK